MADAGLVIKEGDVVVPSEQQGTGFQNNCTHSLAVSWEPLGEKTMPGNSLGRQIFVADSDL